MELGVKDLKRLAELLKVDEEDSNSDDELPIRGIAQLGPGNIGPQKQSVSDTRPTKVSIYTNIARKNDPLMIWGEDEIPEGAPWDEAIDSRQQPDYDISYSQTVSPEDVFLQLTGKSLSTDECDEMVVKIWLHDEDRSLVDLEVTQDRLNVRSPRYRLCLALPRRVDPDKGKGYWNEEEQTLKVSLPLVREIRLP